MSTKPSDTGRFAVDGSDVDAVNISAPSSGLRDTGFPDDYVPPAGEFNYLENLGYRWRQWLDDGDVEFNSVSTTSVLASNVVTDTLNVIDVTATGDADIVGALTVQGNTDLGGALAVTNNNVPTGISEVDCGSLFTFTPFTFTADNTTETFTKTAHGLHAFDGPVRLTNSGGALPTGLLTATDYWISITSFTANSFKLATSLLTSIIGPNITISDNGTGTHTLSSTASTRHAVSATLRGSVVIDGVLASTGYIVLGADQDIRLQGTGSVKH
mgnify:FL=1